MKLLKISGILFVISFTLFGFQTLKTSKKLYPKLTKYVKNLPHEFLEIDAERQEKLKKIGDYIVSKKTDNQEVKLTVICTHNSRRSHLGELWLSVAAHTYGISGISTFSGGTEATAFNPRAVKALQEVGFKINKTNNGTDTNPEYETSFSPKVSSEVAFSKKYTHEMNPSADFGAILVCSSADKACPMVLGADARFAIPFEDPKNFDGTAQESKKYLERCRQIAREMFFVMDYVKVKLVK